MVCGKQIRIINKVRCFIRIANALLITRNRIIKDGIYSIIDLIDARNKSVWNCLEMLIKGIDCK